MWLGLCGKPFGVLFELSYPNWCNRRQHLGEGVHRKRLLIEVRRFFDESLFVDSQQVLSGRVVLFFPVPAFVNRAIAYEPNRELRRLFSGFYSLGHLIPGVTHLVQGKGPYPSICSDALGVAVFALNFRHDFVLAAIATAFNGEKIRVRLNADSFYRYITGL